MKKWWIILAINALFPVLLWGQCTSTQEKPAWVDGYFEDLDNSYIEKADASGYTQDEARNKAATVVMKNRGIATGVRVENGNILSTSENTLTVKARVVDEYTERCSDGMYHVYLLVQTAKNPTYNYEKIKVTNDYPFSPRVFVPGMAQLYKGSTTKGVCFIVGEVALVGGIVVCEGLRASYTSKINTTHDVQEMQNYINNADNMQNMRNAFIAGAAALYVWNVIDGIVAKGKKRVMVLGDAQLNIAPYVAPQMGNMAGGVSLSFNF